MNTVFFKIIGIFAFSMDALMLWAYAVSLMSDHPSDLIGLSVRVGGTVLFMTATGIGLLYLRKWAAVLSSIFFAYIAVRWFYDASSMASGRAWVGVSISILFLIPLIVTIKYWSTLKPGGRWYL